MPRGACTFRQRDLTAVVKAMEAAGKVVDRAEIEPSTGKIIVFVVADDMKIPVRNLHADALDQELAEFEARHGQG